MTVSLELLSRGPSRPDLLEDLVADEATLAGTLARWSAPAPVVVAPAAGIEPIILPSRMTEMVSEMCSTSCSL